jgi:hypothetical protein
MLMKSETPRQKKGRESLILEISLVIIIGQDLTVRGGGLEDTSFFLDGKIVVVRTDERTTGVSGVPRFDCDGVGGGVQSVGLGDGVVEVTTSEGARHD